MKGVVAAGDRLTAKAAADILREGGNAFDAACAAMLCAPLCEPMLSSLGGGGFMMAHENAEIPVIYDFFVDVPTTHCKTPDFFPVYVDFGNAVQEFHIGAGSIAIPGMIAGIEKISKEKGTMPLKSIISPAIEYARNGIYLTKLQASFVKLLEPILRSTKESSELFVPQNRLIDEKSKIFNHDYADFLETFSKEGSDIFYKGEIASKIDEMCRNGDGSLRMEDLENYTVKKRKPIAFSYKGYDILTNPPPSAGGILISFTMKMLEDADDSSIEKYLKELIESMVITSDFRKTHIDRNLHDPELRKIMSDDRLLSHYHLSKKSRINLWGNTTHISVLDSKGNCASATITNGEGSGLIAPGTGIMLNNMLGEEDLNPHGFFRWPQGVRLPSMMAPTIVLDDRGKPVLVLGSAGSNRIRSAIVEVTNRYITFGEKISEAIEAPRVHYEQGKLFFEPGCSPKVIEKAKKIYEVSVFSEKNLFFGGVNAVTGDFDAGADPRRGGSVEKV